MQRPPKSGGSVAKSVGRVPVLNGCSPGDVTEKHQMFEQVESSRLDARRKVDIHELASRTLHSE